MRQWRRFNIPSLSTPQQTLRADAWKAPCLLLANQWHLLASLLPSPSNRAQLSRLQSPSKTLQAEPSTTGQPLRLTSLARFILSHPGLALRPAPAQLQRNLIGSAQAAKSFQCPTFRLGLRSPIPGINQGPHSQGSRVTLKKRHDAMYRLPAAIFKPPRTSRLGGRVVVQPAQVVAPLLRALLCSLQMHNHRHRRLSHHQLLLNPSQHQHICHNLRSCQ